MTNTRHSKFYIGQMVTWAVANRAMEGEVIQILPPTTGILTSMRGKEKDWVLVIEFSTGQQVMKLESDVRPVM